MDHSHYRYSALPLRPATGGGLHACVLLCLEHWHALAPDGAVRDPRFVGEFGSFTPDWRSWTQREYGLRVGVWRVLDALAQAGLRPAVAANAHVLQRVPQLVRRLTDQGCEWVGHGLAANDLVHARMDLAAQRDHIVRSLDAIEAATGTRPRGWLSQDWGTTPDTFELLARQGLHYTLDWCNDDQAYPLQAIAAHGAPLAAVPLSPEWDDVQCQWLRQVPPREHAALALAAFDRLRGECELHGRSAVFVLPLHPWVCGMASRIGPLKTLLRELAARPGVRWTDPGAIAAGARATPA